MLPLAWEALASASTSSRILCRKVRSLALLCRLSKPRIRATPKGKMFMLKESNPRSGKPPRNHGSKQSRRPNSKSDQSMIPQYLRFLFIRISLAVLAGSLAPGIIGSSSPQFTSSHFSLGTESKAVSLLMHPLEGLKCFTTQQKMQVLYTMADILIRKCTLHYIFI